MKRIYIFCSVLLCLLLGSCKDYDDSAIQDKLNDFKERIAALKEKADKLNEDISKLGHRHPLQSRPLQAVTQGQR